MRIRRGSLAVLAFVAIPFASPGCGKRPAPDGAPVAAPIAHSPSPDTVATTVVTVTDTLGTAGQESAPDPREPRDRCRYADRRRQARSGDANYGAPYDPAAMSRGVTLRCALRQAGPEVRLVVMGNFGIPMAVDVFIPATAARATQRLFMEDNDERAQEGSGLVYGEDLNRDGWTDLKVKTWSGSGGVFYDVFMYDPRVRRFAKDSLLSGGGGVVPLDGSEPCVGTGRRNGGGNWTSDDFCWCGGRWVHVRQRQQELLGGYPATRYVLTLREPRGGRLVTVRVDTTAHDAAEQKRGEDPGTEPR